MTPVMIAIHRERAERVLDMLRRADADADIARGYLRKQFGPAADEAWEAARRASGEIAGAIAQAEVILEDWPALEPAR